ncbi:MAG: kinase-like domain-containing protein [Monoraphidium minutum]|nr:MAG: kinase-like domain-containing protein [Monoraphidium minutum]
MSNATRVCDAYVSRECEAAKPLDQCLTEGVDDWLAGGGAGAARRAAAAAGGAVAGVAVLAAFGALLWHRRRRRQQQGEPGAEPGSFNGPLADALLPESKGRWRVVARHSRAPGSSSAGAASAGPPDHLKLGVLLGAGSFGRVYKGRWRGRDVAVKVMQHDAATAARVASEAALMMSFAHPNIVQAFDCISWVHCAPGAAPPASSTAAGAKGSTPPSGSSGRLPLKPAPAPAPRPPVAPAADDSAEAAAGLAPAHPAAGEPQDGEPAAAPPQPATQPATDAVAAAAAAAAAQLPLPGFLRGVSVDFEGGGGHEACGDGSGAPPARERVSFIPVGGAAGAPDAPETPQPGAAPPAPQQAPPPSQQPPPPHFHSAAAARHSSGASCGADASSEFVPMGVLKQQQQQQQQQQQEAATAPGAPPAADSSSGPLVSLAGPFSRGSAGAVGGSTLGDDTSRASAEGTADAQTWLICEYCDGGTLADALHEGRLRAAGGTADMPKLLSLLRQIASAMSYLHDRGVLHGDLKAANVLLSRDASAPHGAAARVSDFGLSRVMSAGATHRSTRTLGTITHCGPEVLRLGKMSPAADVYAFGVLMWEAWSGGPAFGAAHYGEVFERVVIRDERPPIPPAMPEAYALLLTSCWATDPPRRPTFASILQCLQLMLQAEAAPGGPGGAIGSSAFVQDL